MAVIQKLRNSKIVAGVIMGALILFVLGELFKGNNNNNGGQNENVAGVIGGQKVSAKDYEDIKQELTQEIFQAYGSQADPKAIEKFVKDASWRELIDRKVKNKLYSDLGVSTTTDEIMGLIKKGDIPQAIKQVFRNETSEQILTTIQQQYKNNPQFTNLFNFQLKASKKERTEKKYSDLISKSLFATDVEAENDYISNTTKLSGKVVSMDYYEVPDDKIAVTDEELSSYFKENKKDFKQEEARDIEYTSWSLLPSAADSANVFQRINDLKKQFVEASSDSSFARSQSQVDYNPNFFSVASPEAKSIPSEAINMPVGNFYGPVLRNGAYTIYKKLGVGIDTITNYRASHILIKPRGIDTGWAFDQAKKIRARITDAKSFAAIAQKESQGPSAVDGGDLGWFSKGKMVKEFEKFAFTHSKGQMGIVKTQFGVHIIRITENPTRKTYKMAQVSRLLRAGKGTKRKLFKEIRQFNAKVRSSDKSFSEICQSMKLQVGLARSIKPKDETISGVQNSKEIVKWLYNDARKQDDISPEYNIGDKIYIAKAVNFREKDNPKLDDIKQLVTKKVREQKKGKIITKKFNKVFKNKVSAEELAISLGKVAQSFDGVNFSEGNIVGLGSDFNASGAVFGMKENTNSGIKNGNNGVYIVYLDRIEKGETQKTWKARRESLAQSTSNMLMYQFNNGALNEALDIKDDRYKIY